MKSQILIRETFSFHSDSIRAPTFYIQAKNLNFFNITCIMTLIDTKDFKSYLRIFYSESFLGRFKVNGSLINIYDVGHL